MIPACNEAERVGPVIDGIFRVIPDADVLVIDDGSQDDTALVAREHGAMVIRHPINLGYGSALHTGYLYGVRHDYDRVVQLDSDGQHDPISIPDLLAHLDKGADVVLGSRYLRGDAPDTSLSRMIGTRFFAWVVSKWTKVRITDPTSGYQALSRRALVEVAHESFPEDYPDADVLICHARAGLDIIEIPVQMHPRSGGISMHRGGRVAFYVYKMCLTLPMIAIRRRSTFRAGRHPQATS